MIEEISLSQLQEKYLIGKFKVLKINLQFPIDSFHKTIDSYIQKYGTQPKDGYDKYKGIAMQYLDEENPYFDAVQSSDYLKSEKKIFIKKNDLARDLDEIYKTFSVMRLSRGRVIIAEPKFKMAEHVDGAYINTMHIPIQTNKQAGLVIGGENFFLPADGSAYLINATIPHYAYNDSETESRIHITFPIGPPSFMNWKRSQLEMFKPYFQMMKMPLEKFKFNITED